jgi:hypothetical protein
MNNADSPAAANAAAVDADRARRAAILALPEAAGAYQKLAMHLGDHSGMSVEEARECLLAAHEDATRAATGAPPPSLEDFAPGESRLAGIGLGGGFGRDRSGRGSLAEHMDAALARKGH